MRIGGNNFYGNVLETSPKKNVHGYIPSENVHGHIPMESQTCWGLRLSLTRPSMMAGNWVSIKVLHCSSMEAPRRLPSVWQSSLKKATIWSSVVSLVMKLSRSVMMSMQIEQVSSFLLLGTAWEDATRADSRKRAAFIFFLCLLFLAFLGRVVPC